MQFRIDFICEDQVGIEFDAEGNAYVRMPNRTGHGLEVLIAVAEPMDQDSVRKQALAEASAISQEYIPVEIDDPKNWTGEGSHALIPRTAMGGRIATAAPLCAD